MKFAGELANKKCKTDVMVQIQAHERYDFHSPKIALL